MITFMFVSVAALSILLDYIFYKRNISHRGNRPFRATAIALSVISNMMPAIPIVVFWLSPDNSMVVMDTCMWITTLYCLFILPKTAFYIGYLPITHRPINIVVGTVLFTTTLAILVISATYTRRHIVVKECRLEYQNLPDSFNDYRIVFFSDLHIGAMLNARNETKEIVDRINRLSPDLVIFGGDLVNVRYSELTEDTKHMLGGIRATDGIVAVMGNHDTGIYIKDTLSLPRYVNISNIESSMKDMGWVPLRNSTMHIHRGDDCIAVTGIDFTDTLLEYRHSLSIAEEYDVTDSFADVPDSMFNITVTHMPHLWRNIISTGHGDLTLAGHVHATQIKLEVGNMKISPAMFMYKEWSGIYHGADNHNLYINDGVGNVGFYMRIGANPEITFINLHN